MKASESCNYTPRASCTYLPASFYDRLLLVSNSVFLDSLAALKIALLSQIGIVYPLQEHFPTLHIAPRGITVFLHPRLDMHASGRRLGSRSRRRQARSQSTRAMTGVECRRYAACSRGLVCAFSRVYARRFTLGRCTRLLINKAVERTRRSHDSERAQTMSYTERELTHELARRQQLTS